VTERNKDEVLERYEQLQEQGIENVAPSLKKAADAQVYNTSEYTFESLCNDPDDIAENLQYYINQYDEETKKIFEKFAFNHQIDRLADADLFCIRSSGSSPKSISTPMRSQTRRWATSTRSSSGNSTS